MISAVPSSGPPSTITIRRSSAGYTRAARLHNLLSISCASSYTGTTISTRVPVIGVDARPTRGAVISQTAYAATMTNAAAINVIAVMTRSMWDILTAGSLARVQDERRCDHEERHDRCAEPAGSGRTSGCRHEVRDDGQDKEQRRARPRRDCPRRQNRRHREREEQQAENDPAPER